ncbi:hypothetical protein IKW72_06880 [bacterium]|nr:hypothetical protein [bacterium]
MSQISQTVFFLGLLMFAVSPLMAADSAESRYASPLERHMANDEERIRTEELKRQPNQNMTVSAPQRNLTAAASPAPAASAQTQPQTQAKIEKTEEEKSDSFWDYQPDNIVDGLVFFAICVAAAPFVFIYTLCDPDTYKNDSDKSESGDENKTK